MTRNAIIHVFIATQIQMINKTRIKVKLMQTKLPDIKELQELPEKIKTELKNAARKLKKEVLTNFAAINDWILKTSQPDKWVREFDNISGSGLHVHYENDGNKFNVILHYNTNWYAEIEIVCIQGKPIFNTSDTHANPDDSRDKHLYYFDEDDVFVLWGGKIIHIQEAKKMALDKTGCLENNIKDIKTNKLMNRFKKIKDLANLTRLLNTNKEYVNDLNVIERRSRGKYPMGILDDYGAFDFFEKAINFLTKLIPSHVQGMIDEKRKELERVCKLADKEKETVSIPTIDEIMMENDENFKRWNQSSGKLQGKKIGNENEKIA